MYANLFATHSAAGGMLQTILNIKKIFKALFKSQNFFKDSLNINFKCSNKSEGYYLCQPIYSPILTKRRPPAHNDLSTMYRRAWKSSGCDLWSTALWSAPVLQT